MGLDLDLPRQVKDGIRQLRGVLTRLEAKQQALIFGHALPMPLVIHTREYGSAESYESLSRLPARARKKGADGKMETPDEQLDREVSELF